ncbi:SusC/RagA family TonB-linked outer membrane protein [Pedobacter nototheniae]|uniref:SusC/RagA family TonB-linked outer membrane protein n=1 Tax=Pedobacter nototheniae TaxID=2488994 RepID=UPI00103C334F|nr:SusC/RagA family TonB-linked outer membrane protein [Pedobacter nototheniae]
MKKITITIVLALLCLNFKANAQTIPIQITGTVSNGTGKYLPGATIKIKSSKKTALTDKAGNFTLQSEHKDGTLVISFLGYKTREINFDINHSFLNIILNEESGNLDEIQIIGYGQTTKRLNTGSISSVKAQDLERQPVSNPLAALQGRVPGMVINQSSGVAGSSFSAQIRGQSALDMSLSKNDPLFIIDGVPFEAGNTSTNQINSAANNPNSISSGGLSPLNNINPQDIESIDVLKDADATAIYGSRAANGVILITTKKGASGSTRFNLNLYSGFSEVGKTMNMLNTQEYIQMRKEAFSNNGYVLSTSPSSKGYAPDIMLWDTTRYTDFKKLLIGNTAHSNNIQATLTGGGDLTHFLISGTYHKETTVYGGNFSDQIGSLRFNINHSSTDKRFNINFSGNYSSDKNKLPRTDLTRYINIIPNLRLYNAEGKLSWAESGVAYNTINDLINPLSLLEEKYTSVNENLAGSLHLSYKLWKGLVIKSTFGYTTYRSQEVSTRPQAAIDPNRGELSSSAFANAVNKNWIIEPQLDYQQVNRFGKFSLLIGSTFQSKSGNSNSMYGTNYNSDLLLKSIAAAGNITASNEQVQYRYAAIFGRLNYTFEDKYILNLSVRRDGSSRFGPDRQWADFWAIGTAWLFANENFVKNNLSFLSYGKLRSSYGTTGNDQIGDYKFLNLWSSTVNTYNGVPGLYPSSLFNSDYNWEINKKFEVAIELGFWKDAVLVNAAYYNNRSGNQLINYSLASQTGFFNVVKNFPGLVENSGLELVATTRNMRTDKFNWSTSFNITFPKNRLLAFPGLSNSSYASQYKIGESLNLINVYKYLGVNPQTGIYAVEDVNNDGQFNSNDYQLFGNRDPKYYGGVQNNISFKNFDLSFFFQFTKQTGLSYVNQLSTKAPGRIYNQPDVVLNRWQKPGDETDIQKFTSTSGAIAGGLVYLRQSNGIYTDASFIKLKNISLSYKLPSIWLKRIHINNCRFYAEAQNVLTITNYVGADPENQNFYMLPPLKTIVLGIQLTL